MNVQEIAVSELIPYENNPRNNMLAVDAVTESIRNFGFKVPIVIDSENVIVCGHTRLMAAKKLGLDKVPCIVADDLTDEQIKAFRLADNKTAELAEWDFSKLEAELAELADIDMSQFGFEELTDFNESTLDDLFADAPEKEKKPKTAKCPHCGEVFEI
ncbi:MAG: ParB N-terminal domain-containing protein [Ruminococcus sp.]|nr:ParB N-terminal domain-containing protein [Ruminococcus sp.]